MPGISVVNEPLVLTSGSTTLGNGVSLTLNAQVLVKDGATVILDIPNLPALFGQSLLVIEPGGSVTIQGKTTTVLPSTILKIRP